MNTSRKGYSLNGHCPESSNIRADKMSGDINVYEDMRGVSKRMFKKFTNKKRRQLLKQNTEDKI